MCMCVRVRVCVSFSNLSQASLQLAKPYASPTPTLMYHTDQR